MRIAVTGSSGKLGSASVERLRAAGHEVLGLDRRGSAGPGFTQVELGDYGQVLDALLGVTARHDGLDAVVHLAALPVNGLVPDVTTFTQNLTASFHVLHAALRAGVDRIVTASSITAMGFPDYADLPGLPLDERHLQASTTYALGKVAEEAVAAQLVGWRDGLSITALRFTNVVAPDEYGTFLRAGEEGYRRDLLGTYVDVRDGALAVDLALAHGEPGFAVHNVAAADSGVDLPSAAFAARHHPGVPLHDGVGTYETLLSIDSARRHLGYEPRHTWRQELARWQEEQAAALDAG